jgi:hypothetical protein
VYSLQTQQRLASVDAVFFGLYGDVTRLAQQRGTCRQTLYREAHALARAAEDTQQEQPLRRLQDQAQQLQQQGQPLCHQLAHAVVIDRDKQAEFAAVAQAEGVSLPLARRLLSTLLKEDTPSVAQLGRFAQDAARRATVLLEVLDPLCRLHVRHAALDELFAGRRPVLMAVELDSLVWAVGQLSPTRDGAAWAAQLRPLTALELVTRDAGTGLDKGIALVNAQRRAQGRLPIDDQDDHFHLLREGTRALRRLQGRASRALAVAEKADKARAKVARQGRKQTGVAAVAARAWCVAEAAFDRWSVADRAWERVRREALPLFTPSGQRNTRVQAEAVLAAVGPALSGSEWDKVQRLLRRPGVFTYLDRVEKELASLPVLAELVPAAVQVEGGRRRPAGSVDAGPRAAAQRGVLLVAAVTLGLAGEAGAKALALVRGVLGQAWRASSAVEGLNSIVRMHQGRHRRLTQSLLDLKRLYWNCRVFRTGKRRKQTPYGRLGLTLPTSDWWQLLKMPADELRQRLTGAVGEQEQQLSAPQLAA